MNKATKYYRAYIQRLDEDQTGAFLERANDYCRDNPGCPIEIAIASALLKTYQVCLSEKFFTDPDDRLPESAEDNWTDDSLMYYLLQLAYRQIDFLAIATEIVQALVEAE